MSNTTTTDSTHGLLKQLVRALDDKKAADLRILKVGEKSSITDYLVLATGTSEPHLRALRIEVEKVLDAAKHPIAGMEVGTYGSGWMVVDAYQIMAHLFLAEQRANYALEKLWKDAQELDVSALLTDEAPKPAPKRAVKKSVKAKPTTKKAATKKKAAAKKVVAKSKRSVKKK